MRFSVADIRQAGTVEQKSDLNPETILGLPPEFVKFQHPLKTKVQAHMTQTDIVATGSVSTIVSYTCGNCLENFQRPFEVKFQQVFTADQEEIDVTNDIRESVLIDLPLKAVCREDCKGLCPDCGKNRNLVSCRCSENHTDERWHALKEFPFKS